VLFTFLQNVINVGTIFIASAVRVEDMWEDFITRANAMNMVPTTVLRIEIKIDFFVCLTILKKYMYIIHI
jgi:hypothetical protein